VQIAQNLGACANLAIAQTFRAQIRRAGGVVHRR